MKVVENKDTSIPSSMVDVDGEDAMINGQEGAGREARVADGSLKEEEGVGIAEMQIGLVAKFAETAMNGILSGNVMRFTNLNDLQDKKKDIAKTAVILAEALVDEIFKDE